MFKKISSLLLLAMLLVAGPLGRAAGAADKKPAAAPEPVIAASNAFAFKFYKQAAEETGNIFFSPYSIVTALSMAYEGARKETAAEMEKTLGLPAAAGPRQEFFQKDLARLKDTLGVDIVDAFWAQNGYKFLPRYVKLLDTYYHADAFGADFAAAADKARLEINAWTEKKTNGKITDLFPENSLNSLTRLVLVNAVYFKGAWGAEFDKSLTADADFFPAPGSTTTVRMMKREGDSGRVRYAETDDIQILELPYKNAGLSMLILLPSPDGLKKLESALSPAQLDAWRNRLSYERVDILLPRFSLKARYSLNAALSRMGMPAAFTPAADFSGMDGTKRLYIQQAVHQGFVEVNEEGTEAAAATGVAMGLKSMPMPPRQFIADHPFLFLIQEKETGRILFIGRVQQP